MFYYPLTVKKIRKILAPVYRPGTAVANKYSEPDVSRELVEVTEREQYGPPALRPVVGCSCIVMVCTDDAEAQQVAWCLSELNSGYMVTYRRVEDLMQNAPTGKVALVILATSEDAVRTERVLKWLHNRWPRCPVTVVGNSGCGAHELAARIGGANYLTRPITAQQWSVMLSHVFDVRRQGKARERLEERRTAGLGGA